MGENLLHSSAFIFNWIFFIFAGNEDMHESLDEEKFLQIFNRVTAHDWRQNLVFAQYLKKNELTDKNQILFTHYH